MIFSSENNWYRKKTDELFKVLMEMRKLNPEYMVIEFQGKEYYMDTKEFEIWNEWFGKASVEGHPIFTVEKINIKQ